MNDKIFIPTKCKVGFQVRSDTYTKKLGYVIYYDGKVWRKEKSWLSWCVKHLDTEEFEKFKRAEYDDDVKFCIDYYNRRVSNPQYRDLLGSANSAEEYVLSVKGTYENYQVRTNISSDPSLKPFEFDNIPTSGFVLNKKVGGNKYGWNPRQTYTRVYDPRGFEFEISIPNLLYILENTNSIKGKGLEGNFIYGWEGTELILIPENAPEYNDILQFTKIKNLPPLPLKSLKVGHIYTLDDNQDYTYFGRSNLYNRFGLNAKKKVYWFLNNKTNSLRYFGNSKSVKVEKALDLDFAKKLAKEDDLTFTGIQPSDLQVIDESALKKLSTRGAYHKVYTMSNNIIVRGYSLIISDNSNAECLLYDGETGKYNERYTKTQFLNKQFYEKK